MMKGFCLVGPYVHWHLEFDEKALWGTTRYHQVHRSDTILFTTPVTISFVWHVLVSLYHYLSNPKLSKADQPPPRRNNDAAKEIVSEMWADSAVEVVAPWKIPSNHRLILDDIGHSNMPYMQMIEYRITYIRIIVNYNELQYIFFLHRYTACFTDHLAQFQSQVILVHYSEPSTRRTRYLELLFSVLKLISNLPPASTQMPWLRLHDDALRRRKDMNTNVAEDFGGVGFGGGQKSVLIAAFVVEDNHTLDK